MIVNKPLIEKKYIFMAHFIVNKTYLDLSEITSIDFKMPVLLNPPLIQNLESGITTEDA